MDLPYKFAEMEKEELLGWIQDAAKLWMAHDTEAWRRFSPIEAKRIMKRLGLKPGGGIAALIQCLQYRLYAHLNEQELVEESEKRAVFRMKKCRVQLARQRHNLPDFPCKSVGIVEYETFARTIDPRLVCRCVACPPDDHPSEWFCAWEFTLQDNQNTENEGS